MALYVVTGPPGAGKSTWVLARASTGDVVIDYDRLALALTCEGADGHDHHQVVKAVTSSARKAAIQRAIHYRDQVDVYVIHSSPGDSAMAWYRRLGAEVVTIDPGRDVVMRRCRDLRPPQMSSVTRRYYAQRGADDVQLPSNRSSSRKW